MTFATRCNVLLAASCLRAGEFASGPPAQLLTDERSRIEWTR